MSYLTGPTVLFGGTFQSDVPTENNAARFVADPPGETGGGNLNWNPTGSGAFRLLDCAVHAVRDGAGLGAADPIAGALVRGAHDRVSAKIVDLDPQWQGASALWGLRVELVAGDGTVLLAGEFDPAGFRDIWGPPNGGLADAQARFQSVLHDITWAPDGTSATVDRLRAATSAGLLSIRMTTHGFGRAGGTAGSVVGAIGPYLLGEPRRFVSGRRFTPLPPADPNGSTVVGAFDAELSPSGDRLVVDLATAVSWWVAPQPPIGPVRFGVLTDNGTAEGAGVTDGVDVHLLGDPLALDPATLAATGGIVDVGVAAEHRDLVADHPLALVRTSPAPTVLVRETDGGWLARADDETQRVDAGQQTGTRVRVTRYGLPHEGSAPTVQLFSLGGPPPTATPAAAVVPATIDPTRADGWTAVRFDCGDPGNPRGAIDGQVYGFQIDIAEPAPSEMIVLLVFDGHPVPPHPTWHDDVLPILAPYAALYPVMTRRLLDLADYEQVRARRQILQHALSRDVGDPNSMPVTRDLSGPKRRTLLAWLALPDLPLGEAPPDTPHAAPVAPAAADGVDPADAPFVGKQEARDTARAALRDGQS